jgi:hypothetical protein
MLHIQGVAVFTYEGKWVSDFEVNGISPSNAFVKNAWRYTSTA